MVHGARACMHAINSSYGSRCTMDIESATWIAAVQFIWALLDSKTSNDSSFASYPTREVQGMSKDQYELSAQHGGRTLKRWSGNGSACLASMERCFRMESQSISQSLSLCSGHFTGVCTDLVIDEYRGWHASMQHTSSKENIFWEVW